MKKFYIWILIAIALILTGGGYYWWQQKYQTATSGYKKLDYTDTGGEIPNAWSYSYRGDIGPAPLPPAGDNILDSKYILFSFAEHGIAYGDINWSQVDFFEMSYNDVKTMVGNIKAAIKSKPNEWEGVKMSQEISEGNIIANVLTYPLDNGEVTKGGTGGKTYFIAWKCANGTNAGLVINKQALGDKEFEDGFSHYISTMDLANSDICSSSNYY